MASREPLTLPKIQHYDQLGYNKSDFQTSRANLKPGLQVNPTNSKLMQPIKKWLIQTSECILNLIENKHI